ncbi:helix-turn-helix domain-containing protein [Metabacillus bambusae]|uniref:Helix-turn-helix transcriptional regulator n=1 Tax=Metabacillus bambusae TaxID=2795218 RepID=A0ABS3NBJ1_9BACI|nr:helix-turn-helix transcriptional regulator [Metabacillus bambusae]MBO1515657.1 helix-turn-helix transcriptional regulator [Metabacillus bambusae]
MLVPQIRIILAEKGFRQKQIAEKMGVTPQQFSKWVNGVGAYPQADILWKLAKLLNVKVDDLYKFEEE